MQMGLVCRPCACGTPPVWVSQTDTLLHGHQDHTVLSLQRISMVTHHLLSVLGATSCMLPNVHRLTPQTPACLVSNIALQNGLAALVMQANPSLSRVMQVP